MQGRCKLCGEQRGLQASHVMPAFVTRWLRNSSATGHIRFNRSPNKRVQDSEKRYWLCQQCEQKFSAWEKAFSKKIFLPINDDSRHIAPYSDWLLKFCVSISWRSLLFMSEEGGLDTLSEAQKTVAREALETWAEFLKGSVRHPGKFEQHFLPLDAVGNSTDRNLPANINRYLLRTIGIDVVQSSDTTFVYSKLCKFVIFGFIDVKHPQQWEGTKVRVGGGVIGPRKYALPHQLRGYIVEKANQVAALHRGMSENQRKVIDATMWRDLDRVASSGTFEAMRHDVDIFGQPAFDVLRPKTK